MARAIRFHQTGGPEVLELEQVDVGEPGPGQARVRHTYVAVNFIDIYFRTGRYPLALPNGIGSDAVGVVEAVGEGVVDVSVGDRVGYLIGPQGAYSDVRVLPADVLIPLPEGVSDRTASALMMKGLTAQYLFRQVFPLHGGETILYHAAAGGVGLIACQWAFALGVKMIGTVSSDEKAEIAKAHGCTHTIVTGREDIAKRVRELTDGRGVPVVYDSVGKDTLAASLDSLQPRGTLVSNGTASGPVVIDSMQLAAKGSLWLTRPAMMHYIQPRSHMLAMADELFGHVLSGRIVATPKQEFALADAAEAHRALESRKTVGSTVLGALTMDLQAIERAPRDNGYLVGRGPAWFAFAMTLALMIFDYVDRQVIVSLFPYLKAEWSLSDKQLGGLVSVISVTVALGALPVALYADRVSRVRSIVAMAAIWSLATISCMWARTYPHLLAARAVVGLGEAGYGSVGAALIASHFPDRMRGALLAGFFASASIGSVLGVMLGGMIAAKWGWQAAFGVVGVPGLVLALLYLKVRDYETVKLAPALDAKRQSLGEAIRHIVAVLARSRTMLWVCIGGAAQLVVVSALWSWLPSFLNRVHGVAPGPAGMKAALVVLAGAAGAVMWGAVVDRAGVAQPRRRLLAMALLCLASMVVLVLAFGLALAPAPQFALIAVGGFLATCTVGPVSAIVIDVIHPGVRATGSSVLALFQNLFGLAAGPFIAGLISDAWGLVPALTTTPLFALGAAGAFLLAARSYAGDKARAAEPIPLHGLPTTVSA